MQMYEYKVIPAPAKGRKAPGIKGPEARFAHGLELAMNALAAEGWDYLRADILPSEERQGLTSTQTVYRSVLVFRRAIESDHVDTLSPLPWDTSEFAVTKESVEEAESLPEDVEAPTDPDQSTRQPESERREPPFTRGASDM